jgi:hypothetical protein
MVSIPVSKLGVVPTHAGFLLRPEVNANRVLRAIEVQKKADVDEHPRVSDHVGLLFNEPPSEPGCSLFSHPTNIIQIDSGTAFIVNASPLTRASYRAD